MQSGAPATILEPHDAHAATSPRARSPRARPSRASPAPAAFRRGPPRGSTGESNAVPARRTVSAQYSTVSFSVRSPSSRRAPRIVSHVPTIIGTNLDEARVPHPAAREFRDPDIIIDEDDLLRRIERLAGEGGAQTSSMPIATSTRVPRRRSCCSPSRVANPAAGPGSSSINCTPQGRPLSTCTCSPGPRRSSMACCVHVTRLRSPSCSTTLLRHPQRARDLRRNAWRRR